MDAELAWAGGLRFDAEPPSGFSFSFDSVEDGEPAGPSPMETLLVSLAACTAMDVISILEKKRQKVTSYKVRISGDRPPAGEWPRPFERIMIKHIVGGEDIDPAAVERAIELSDGKYCSVAATLRHKPEVVNDWEIA
ncbi:MAG: OsmC family protein [Fimbriimonadales bacterium]